MCNLFAVKTNPSVVSREIEPRLNQTALSLLSIVDDEAFRREIVASLTVRHDEIRQDRSESIEAGLTAALLEAFDRAPATPVSVGDIATRFNATAGSEYGHVFSNKWVGAAIRTKLHLVTRKSHGVYIISASEKVKIDALAARYGVLKPVLIPEVAVSNTD